jgi:hypothetical protein
MPKNCQCSSPGFCTIRNQVVRWADIQTCPQNQPAQSTTKDCRSCTNAGPIIVDASGSSVGSKGCGCSSSSKASGDTWLTCLATSGPVRAIRAKRCNSYAPLMADDR